MLKKALIGLLVLVVLAGFLIARDWDSPELGRAVLTKVGQATNIQIEAEGFKLNLLKGLVLERVSGVVPGQGGELAFSLDQLVFEHRIGPLFSGAVAIDRVLLASPQLTFTEWPATTGAEAPAAKPGAAPPSPSTPPPATDAAGEGFALDVTLVQIDNATLVTKSAAGAEQLRVDGFDFVMRDLNLNPALEGLAALSAQGTLAIAEVHAGTHRLQAIEGGFELAESMFKVPGLRFSTPSMTVRADAEIDFTQAPLAYTLDATGDADLNVMLGAPGGLGPAKAAFDAKGAGSDPKALNANGKVQLSPGQIPAIPLFTRIEQAVGKPVLSNTPYQATDLAFSLVKEHLTLQPFHLTTPLARLGLGGQANLGGPIDLDIGLATPRSGITVEGVGSSVLDVLADNEGWVELPMAVTGTLQDPRVRPDVKTLASMAAEGAKREAKEKATEAARGFIDRRLRRP